MNEQGDGTLKRCDVKHRSAKAKSVCPDCKRGDRAKKVLGRDKSTLADIASSVSEPEFTDQDYKNFITSKNHHWMDVQEAEEELWEAEDALKDIRKLPVNVRSKINVVELERDCIYKKENLDISKMNQIDFFESNRELAEKLYEGRDKELSYVTAPQKHNDVTDKEYADFLKTKEAIFNTRTKAQKDYDEAFAALNSIEKLPKSLRGKVDTHELERDCAYASDRVNIAMVKERQFLESNKKLNEHDKARQIERDRERVAEIKKGRGRSTH